MLAVTAGGPQADIVSEDAKQIVRAAGAEEGRAPEAAAHGSVGRTGPPPAVAIPSLRPYVIDTGRPLTPDVAARVAELTSRASLRFAPRRPKSTPLSKRHGA